MIYSGYKLIHGKYYGCVSLLNARKRVAISGLQEIGSHAGKITD
jgi:hypothetical protein